MTSRVGIGLAIASMCAACSTSGGRAADTESGTETSSRSSGDTLSNDDTDSQTASATSDDTESPASDVPTESQSSSVTQTGASTETGTMDTVTDSESETRTLPDLDTDYTTEGLESGEMVWITFAESWRTMYGDNVAATVDGTLYWALHFDRWGFFPFVEESIIDFEGVQSDNSVVAQCRGPAVRWADISRSKSLDPSGSEPIGLLADDDGVTMLGNHGAFDLVFSPDDDNETSPLNCHSGSCGYVVRFDTQGTPQWVYQPAGTNGVVLVASAVPIL